MLILYVLECMLHIIALPEAAGHSILATTQREMSVEDIFVGIGGYVVLICLILGIMVLVRYLKWGALIRKELREKPKKQIYTKNQLIMIYAFASASIVMLIIGVFVSIFASAELNFIRNFGIIATIGSIFIPLFWYLWKLFDV